MPLTIPRPSGLGWLVPRGRASVASLVLAVTLAVGSGVVLTTSAAESLPAGAILEYRGNIVTEEQLSDRVSSLEALYGVTPPTDVDDVDDFRRAAAKSAAVGLVLEHEAVERDIVVSDKQARAELSKIISDRLGGDRDAFVRFLADAGVTEGVILEEIKRTIATNRLFEAVTADVPDATEAEARKEYDARRADMTTPEKRVLRNIVVASKEDADAVHAALGSGAAFARVARTSSLDASTKDNDGRLGTVEETELDPAYAAVAFAARQGAVFGPVQSQHGWNVGKVERVVPGEPLGFEQVRATLVQALTSRAQLDAWRDWLGDVLERADVEYADEYRPADPTSAPADVEPTEEPR